MKTKILLLGVAIAMVSLLAAGCGSGRPAPKSAGRYEIVRQAVLGGKWQMYQFRLDLKAGSELDIDLLNLAPGDRVEGYFYPEKGSGAALTVKAGPATVYQSAPLTGATDDNGSDRFSFEVNQPLGTAYVLLFTNPGTDSEVTLLLELIYPANGQIRGPIGAR